nr:crosslink repair DNA glycosylase YcaQ family protein [Streptomyces melanogenes]
MRLGGALATARRHGLGRTDLDRGADQARQALAGGALGYRDLQDHLAKQYSETTVEAVRMGIKRAWESGHIAYRNTAPTLHREQRAFALLEHAHPGLTLHRSDPVTAAVALVRRYLGAYGPAAEGDLTWWSGLTRAEITPALTALRDEITPVHVEGLPATLLVLSSELDTLRGATPLPADHVRLTAFEDPAFKGYFTTRARYLEAAHTERAFNPIGEVRAAITVAGRITGTWWWDKQTRTVGWDLFARPPRGLARVIRQRLEEAEAFLRTEPN